MSEDAGGTRNAEGAESAAASERAQELRAHLGARRSAEEMLVEATEARRAAVADAESIVGEAQELSEQLVAESTQAAARATTEASERADGILARAREEATGISEQAKAAADAVRSRAEQEAEAHRARVREEVAEQGRRELVGIRHQSHELIGDVEAAVRILGVSLESAVGNIAEMMTTLAQLRAASVDALPEPRPEDEKALAAGETLVDADNPVFSTGAREPGGEQSTPAQAPQPEAAAQESRDGAAAEAPATRPDSHRRNGRQGRNGRTAKEDKQVREVDAVTSAEKDEETLEVMPSTERAGQEGHQDEDAPARPLGWLFRQAQ